MASNRQSLKLPHVAFQGVAGQVVYVDEPNPINIWSVESGKSKASNSYTPEQYFFQVYPDWQRLSNAQFWANGIATEAKLNAAVKTTPTPTVANYLRHWNR